MHLKNLLGPAIFFIIFLALAMLIEKYQIMSPSQNKDFPLLEVLKNSLANKTDIIFFGESTLWNPNNVDINDTRNTGDMMSDYLKVNYSVQVISHSGYQMDVYEAYSQYVCAHKNGQKFVIVPIHLRSFSPQWHNRPDYIFENEIDALNQDVIIHLLRLFHNLFIDVFKEREYANEIWKKTPVDFNGTIIGTVGDYEYEIRGNEMDLDKRIRERHIFYYLYHLDPGHEKLRSLENTIRNYQKCNISLILYISPIDYEKAVKYVGDDFIKIVDQNKRTIIDVADRNNIRIIDMSYDLNTSYFYEKNYPGEHMFESGRKHIAGKLSDVINSNS